MPKTRKSRVLLYGNINTKDYRAKTLIKILENLNYCVSLVSPDFYRSQEIKQALSIEKLMIVFCWLELFVKAAFADIIYLPPMNSRFIKSAIWAARIFQKKLVVEMYFSLYDTLVRDRQIIQEGSRQAQAVKQKDILALTKADYIIHTSNFEIDYWEKLLNISIDRVKVFISPVCNVSTLVHHRKFQEDGILRICWWGTFIPLHGLDKILQAMKILQQQNLKFTCVLFGVNNNFYIEYANKIKQAGLEHHVLLQKDLNFADDSLPKYLVEKCDLALGIFGDTDKARNAVPNKLIEALSMKIPILTMDAPALQEFFNPGIDFWVCHNSPEAIAESITKIAQGKANYIDWEKTQQKTLNTFSTNQYQNILSKVLPKAEVAQN